MLENITDQEVELSCVASWDVARDYIAAKFNGGRDPGDWVSQSKPLQEITRKEIRAALIAFVETGKTRLSTAAVKPHAVAEKEPMPGLNAAILAQCDSPRICSVNGTVTGGIRCGPCEYKALQVALAGKLDLT